MGKFNPPSSDPEHEEESMAPTAGTAQKKVTENQEPIPGSKSKDDAKLSRPVMPYYVVDAPAPESNEDMPKEEVMSRRIKLVFGLAILAALSSLAGQLRILGLPEVLGFLGAMAILGIATGVAIPQFRRNFRPSP
jgi:hypothetical protein